VFHHDPEHADALTTYTQQAAGQTWLQIEREPKLATHYLDMVPAAVEELLELEGLDRSDIKVVVPPFLAADDRTELAQRIGIDIARFVEFDGECDPFTSSVPRGIDRVMRRHLAQPGDIGLIVTVGSGLQVGCTTYRF
jgi:3-oxoacyl-[acyl-carrier-protein] synthase III